MISFDEKDLEKLLQENMMLRQRVEELEEELYSYKTAIESLVKFSNFITTKFKRKK